MPSMELGSLTDMLDIRKKACLKLSKQQVILVSADSLKFEIQFLCDCPRACYFVFLTFLSGCVNNIFKYILIYQLKFFWSSSDLI